MNLLARALELVKTSPSLQKASLEKSFWESKLVELSEKDLLQFIEVLEKETSSLQSIEEERLDREIAINAQYLDVLKKIRHKVLPTAIKRAEEAVREKENPEDILSKI